MPSRMIHYLIAEKVAEQVRLVDLNRFKLGSLCPDMSSHEDTSKNRTHYFEICGDKKGGNWMTFVSQYEGKMKQDDLYLGVLCHLITDMVWFHEIMETQIRSKVQTKTERQSLYQKGYVDFHRLNYILRKEFNLNYSLEEDRNIELEGLHLELYDEVMQGLYQDFFDDPEAEKDDLEIYTYDISLECIHLCIKECVDAITAFREGKDIINPEKYYVPTY